MGRSITLNDLCPKCRKKLSIPRNYDNVGRKRRIQGEDVIRLRKAGKHPREIAKELGCSVQVVYRRLAGE